jgi:small subunit ribosomal protein S1
VILTTRLSLRDQSKAAVEDAFTAGFPVEGRVVKVIKGGYEVRVSGLRGFCPLSQIDMRWPKEPELHVGKIYTFKVVEYKEKGRNIIVSRRAIMEEERVTRREELKKRIVVGDFVTGTVRNVQSFGAFVDLDGADGLIPVSEMAWSRIEDPKELLTEGQQVTAKVIGVDWDKERISLSLKALAEDPWLAAAKKYAAGTRVKGNIVRLTAFGAFVELEPGLDGMIHISALGADNRIKHPREAVAVGDLVEAEILSIDLEKRRIALSLDYKRMEGLGDLPRVGEVITGQVEKVVDFGVFLKLPTGHTGLIPNMEMNTRKGSVHGQMFRPGDEMEAQVTEVAENGRRIRLSVKALVREKEREARKEYEAFKGEEKATFGTFGDLLKSRQK